MFEDVEIPLRQQQVADGVPPMFAGPVGLGSRDGTAPWRLRQGAHSRGVVGVAGFAPEP